MFFCELPFFSALYQNSPRISPEQHQNSPEVHQNFIGILLAFRQNIECEYLKQVEYPQLGLLPQGRGAYFSKPRGNIYIYIYIYISISISIYLYLSLSLYIYIYIYIVLVIVSRGAFLFKAQGKKARRVAPRCRPTSDHTSEVPRAMDR